MKKNNLVVAMVVVFCGILWLVMGEAMQAYNLAKTLQDASTEIAVLNLNIIQWTDTGRRIGVAEDHIQVISARRTLTRLLTCA